MKILIPFKLLLGSFHAQSSLPIHCPIISYYWPIPLFHGLEIQCSRGHL